MAAGLQQQQRAGKGGRRREPQHAPAVPPGRSGGGRPRLPRLQRCAGRLHRHRLAAGAHCPGPAGDSARAPCFFVFFFTSARMLPPGRVTDYVNLGMDSSTMQSLSADCTPPLEAVLGLRLWRQPHTCRSGCSPRLRRLLCIPNLSRHALSQVTWLPRSCGNTGCVVVLSAHAAVSSAVPVKSPFKSSGHGVGAQRSSACRRGLILPSSI